MNTLTARLSLDLLDLKEGQTIAVTGGPSAYGGYVIELAKLEGLTVIADSKPDDEDLLRSLGVDIIIPRGEGFADRVREHFPEGVDGIADGALLNESLQSRRLRMAGFLPQSEVLKASHSAISALPPRGSPSTTRISKSFRPDQTTGQ